MLLQSWVLTASMKNTEVRSLKCSSLKLGESEAPYERVSTSHYSLCREGCPPINEFPAAFR